MDDKRRAIFTVLAGFCLVSLLLSWSFIFKIFNTFRAGTRPNEAAPVSSIQPKLPPIRSTDPSRGSTSTDAIVIVQFSDYTCQYCRAVMPEISAIVNAYPEEIRYVWRDLPVTSDRPDSMLAAVAGRCAQEQNAFWRMHDELMRMPIISMEAINSTLDRQRINPSVFKKCMLNEKHITDIQKDIQTAKDHGLTGVPTIFVGDEALTGYVKATDLQWAIFKNRIF